jgi:hypothetical protein
MFLSSLFHVLRWCHTSARALVLTFFWAQTKRNETKTKTKTKSQIFFSSKPLPLFWQNKIAIHTFYSEIQFER